MVSKCNESNRSTFVTDELRRESLQKCMWANALHM